MRASRLLPVTLGIVLLVSWLSVAFYPSQGDYASTNPSWNGLDLSQAVPNSKVIKGFDSADYEGRDSVLIAIPATQYQQWELDHFNAFVRDGGTLLLADDFGSGNQVLEALGLQIRFSSNALVDPYLSYRNKWFPRITDLAPDLAQAGVKSIVLNHASGLEGTGPYEVLARSSDTSLLVETDTDTSDVSGPFPVAVRARLDRGTVFVISDSSILTSGMLSIEDNALFIKSLISHAGENTEVLIDSSHLNKAPLDRARHAWEITRDRLAVPYLQVLLVGAVLALTTILLWRKGLSNGRQ